MSRRRRLWTAVSFVLTPALAFGLYWFQPWKLFTNHTVNETLPSVATEPVPGDDATSSPTAPEPAPSSTRTARPSAATSTPPVEAPDDRHTVTIPPPTTTSAKPAATTASTTAVAPRPAPTTEAPHDVLLSRGTLISHEHDTSGTVSVVRLANGHRVLAIAHLDTSDGPDVEVWLTDRRVTKDGWYVFDDGRHLDLGDLKGNLGNQVYPIPDSADLSTLTSVSLWCDRFDVSFGAAELTPVR